MAIFHCYVSSPEGTCFFFDKSSTQQLPAAPAVADVGGCQIYRGLIPQRSRLTPVVN